jgi:hypothetical protein
MRPLPAGTTQLLGLGPKEGRRTKPISCRNRQGLPNFVEASGKRLFYMLKMVRFTDLRDRITSSSMKVVLAGSRMGRRFRVCLGIRETRRR